MRCVALLVCVVFGTACGANEGATMTTEPSTVAPATVAPATVAITTVAPSTVAPTTEAPQPASALFDFGNAASVAGWVNVDDTVMGGVSSSSSMWQAGQMVFTGDLSLDNNGGFTSTRSPVDAGLGTLLADASKLIVDATGDGKTYLLQLRTGDDAQYIQRFTTTAGAEQAYPLDLAAFEAVGRFLAPVPDAAPLDPAKVVQVVIYLLDKQDGSFRLAVRRIAAA
jgi:hypothetical protein